MEPDIKVNRIFEDITARLRELGVVLNKDGPKLEVEEREFWRRLALLANPRPIPEVRPYFALSLDEIDLQRIEPEIKPVRSTLEKNLFRHALSYWSIPVTSGYGRRMRFLVWDGGNKKVLGIFGLCDPIVGLGIRDTYIGWNQKQREERLYHCMTAYVLGAVPPYNLLRGAKLVALAAGSNEVREYFRWKYHGKKTVIKGTAREPHLILIDTMGAFGKSSIYNRLKEWKFIGYTYGKTHLHLSYNGLYERISAFMKQHMPHVWGRYRYGHGPNWRIRALREFFKLVGFNSRQFEKLLLLGTKRAYYVCPLASNWREFLKGEADIPDYFDRPFERLFQDWMSRWRKLPNGVG